MTDNQFRKAANRLYHHDGEIEIDDNAKVSQGTEEGAYVMAWVWVPDTEAEEET